MVSTKAVAWANYCEGISTDAQRREWIPDILVGLMALGGAAVVYRRLWKVTATFVLTVPLTAVICRRAWLYGLGRMGMWEFGKRLKEASQQGALKERHLLLQEWHTKLLHLSDPIALALKAGLRARSAADEVPIEARPIIYASLEIWGDLFVETGLEETAKRHVIATHLYYNIALVQNPELKRSFKGFCGQSLLSCYSEVAEDQEHPFPPLS